mmetsp:Transcript_28727/g.82164  ORF Transcript_28727/g.82164 Transcript_28727/m.82164 type:complete len:208 (-) Transcript_28727:381-1004(-)
MPPRQTRPGRELPERRRQRAEPDHHEAYAPRVCPPDTAGVHAEEEMQQVCQVLLPARQHGRGLAAYGGQARASAQQGHRFEKKHEAGRGLVAPRSRGVAREGPAEALQHCPAPRHPLVDAQRPRLCRSGRSLGLDLNEGSFGLADGSFGLRLRGLFADSGPRWRRELRKRLRILRGFQGLRLYGLLNSLGLGGRKELRKQLGILRGI